MDGVPIIKIEVEQMRHTILAAFAERTLNFSSELQLALDRACSPDAIQQTIDKAARDAVHTSIDTAVRRWWSTSETAQELIKQAVTKRLEEEAKFWKGR